MNAWWSDDLEDFGPIDAPSMTSIEVSETDNPVTAVLLATDGHPLIELRERPTVPFGYRK